MFLPGKLFQPNLMFPGKFRCCVVSGAVAVGAAAAVVVVLVFVSFVRLKCDEGLSGR